MWKYLKGSRRISKTSKWLTFGAVAVSLAMVVYFPRAVVAANIFWDNGGGADHNWSNPLNWSGDVVPGSGDIAVFDSSSGAATIDAGFGGSIGGIDMRTGYLGTITHSSGTTLTVGASGFSQVAGTFTGGSGNLDINGRLSFSGGVFTASSNTTSVQAFSLSGGTFIHNNGTFVLDGNNSVDTSASPAVALNNLTIDKSGGFFTLGGSFIVNGTVNLNNGEFLFGGPIDAKGAVNILPTFNSGNGSLTISGPATRIITLAAGTSMPNTTLNSPNVTLATSGSGTLTCPSLTVQDGTINQGGADFAISGPYSQTGGTFNGSASMITVNGPFGQSNGTFTGGSGNLDFNGNFHLSGGTFTASSSTTFVAGQFTHDPPPPPPLVGVFNHNGGTFVLDGNGEFDHNFTGVTFNNLTINKGHGMRVFLNSTLVVAGTMTLADGLTNTGTLEARGAVVVGAAFDGGTGDLTFAGAANQIFTNNGGANPSGTWTFNKPSGKVTLASNLVLQPGQQLNITAGILEQAASSNLTAGPVVIGATGKLTNQGSGDLTLEGSIVNDGVISLNGGGGSCGDADSILIRSLPDGTQRTWSGSGNFFLTDVDVKDQAAANPPVITVFNGTDQPGTNTNFNFVGGCSPTAASSRISGRITSPDGMPVSGAVIFLSGGQTRKTITDADGNYQFGEVVTGGFYTMTPSRANYSFSPGARSFSQLGAVTEATFTALPTGASANPLDTPEYFVRQHYLDFLGREPEESGFNFWSDQLTSCGSDSACVERRRINVSAAYFLSIEFQQTGGLVDRLYRASYRRRPLYIEFMPDTATIARNVIVGRGDWQQQLAANKAAFIDAFAQRAAFRGVYDNLTDEVYVDTLIANTGVSYSQSEREALVNGLSSGTLTRATVLRQVAENERFISAKFTEAFVMMEYFGYLRRDPDESGYQFWLAKLNQFNGNFEQAEMVKAFIVSSEYRQRFEP
ncbi:MAG TPA: DUF4214 domain-containing protein [Pyrinomonadaceae bacterium]|jgi:hypothetical protein|nr:DUF4214 domain-containing protein [Pyrinomonadaceae bacterium]